MKKITFMSTLLCGGILLGFTAFAPKAHADNISLTTVGTVGYTQNFDSLASSGTTSNTVPTNFQYGTNTSGAPAAYTTPAYNINNGSSTSAGVYSYGTTGSTDRAFGSIVTNAVPSALYGFGFTNDTNQVITTLQFSYTGEQWRDNGNAAIQPLNFQFRSGGTSTDTIFTGTYANVDSLTFNSPIHSGSSAALDGNAAANRTELTGFVTGLNIAIGDNFFIRWSDPNSSGNDHALAVDDFSVAANVTATPEPETWAMMAMGVLALGVLQFRRKRSANGASVAADFTI
jgi:hypothetical protein